MIHRFLTNTSGLLNITFPKCPKVHYQIKTVYSKKAYFLFNGFNNSQRCLATGWFLWIIQYLLYFRNINWREIQNTDIVQM